MSNMQEHEVLVVFIIQKLEAQVLLAHQILLVLKTLLNEQN